MCTRNTKCSKYRNRCTSINIGFIPDVITILDKYHLQIYIEQYIQTGSFPSKQKWKRICKGTVLEHEQSSWLARMNLSDDFSRFRVLHNQLVPGNVWRIAKEHSNSLESMTFLAKLSCKVKKRVPIICTICDENIYVMKFTIQYTNARTTSLS